MPSARNLLPVSGDHHWAIIIAGFRLLIILRRTKATRHDRFLSRQIEIFHIQHQAVAAASSRDGSRTYLMPRIF